MTMADAAPNPYRPYPVRIDDIREETPDVRTLSLAFVSDEDRAHFPGWSPGQFGEFTVFGVGESVFAIANRPNGSETGSGLQCTFRAIGKVTTALRRLDLGQVMGFRGPYGNSFPLEEWRGKSLVFIGGGIGMAALRAALLTALAEHDQYPEIHILNGARTVADMVYKAEMPEWEKTANATVVRTVDPGGEDDEWSFEVGLLPAVFERLELVPDNRVVIACGPPVMLHFMFQSLHKMGYKPDQVVTTLENKMKCGFGHCGRCNVGPFFVCKDGPVVTWDQIKSLPDDL
jgi:NAD(P)H-flavin reductase